MKDLDPDKCINQKALIPIVRSVLFVEGELNTNCTVKSNLFGSFKFKIRNKLVAEI